jgi:2-keto-3-deoxy-L-rhamnonate aldolase RhmA
LVDGTVLIRVPEVGAYLSRSIDRPGRPGVQPRRPAGGPAPEAAIRTIVDTALAAGTHVGILCADGDEARRSAEPGARLLPISVDAVVLSAAFADLFDRARPAAPSPS